MEEKEDLLRLDRLRTKLADGGGGDAGLQGLAGLAARAARGNDP
jgi:hypothetical protein